jgi:protein SCO1/2
MDAQVKRPLLIIAAIAAIALAAMLGISLYNAGERAPQQSGVADVGGPFRLVDQQGKPRDETLLKGKWSAVFFGFTYCPEACPTTLLALGQAQDRLGPKGKDLQTVFISVDPERDTPEVVRAYLDNSAFPKNAVGLTGAPGEIDKVTKAYHVFFQKDGEGRDYNVNHSTMTYLMNPEGQFACVLPYGLTPEQLADRIGKAMRAGRGAQTC